VLLVGDLLLFNLLMNFGEFIHTKHRVWKKWKNLPHIEVKINRPLSTFVTKFILYFEEEFTLEMELFVFCHSQGNFCLNGKILRFFFFEKIDIYLKNRQFVQNSEGKKY
jgi:hypothetical protein